MSIEELSKKLEKLPDDAKREVEDFIQFLETKYGETRNQETGEKHSNFGSAKGLIAMSEDFDEPLEDFNPYR